MTSQELVANGYLKRDLALGALVAFHDFHIDKVLSGTTLQKKEILLGDGTTGVLFPGLNTSHFDAIIRFAYEEKWPLTSNGIYKAILKSPSDKSLSQAFSMTPEFRAFELLFQKVQLPKEMLIQLVIEGPFSQLQQFAKEQSERLDLTPEKRRSTLLNYVRFGSKTAGKILAETESPFLVKKLDDPSLIQVLSLLKEKTSSAEFLCLELLRSPRSNDVWMAAVNNLYAYAGKEPPAGVPLREAMAQFLPSPSSEPKVTRSLCRKHVVKEGETFWKIARMYDVKVDDLVSANEIDKNHLRVGMTLNIPE